MLKETSRFQSFIKSTAFREDRSAAMVTITESSFEGCKLVSRARFEVGERLRLHVAGQGLIEAKVEWTSGSTSGVKWLNECHV